MPERRVQDASKSDYDEAVRLSGEALEHALRHRNAPRPRAYDVWYTYAAGEDAALRRVDSELIKTGGVDLDTIEQIYEEHFLEKRLSKGISRIGDELDAGLKQAVAVVREGMGASQRFIGSLTQAHERFEQTTSKGDAKRIVLKLLALSNGQVEQTKAVTAELTKVRAQVVELQAELLRLRDSAYLDHLTQIPNRRHMDEVLDREITVALLHGYPLSFALGDLDHFKKLNDEYGHAVGDALLKNFAALIKDNVKVSVRGRGGDSAHEDGVAEGGHRGHRLWWSLATSTTDRRRPR